MPNVVFMIIDGLRPDALSGADLPHINGLRARGAAALQASSVMPSITLPCHMSMFYSVPPTRHGITTNTYTPLARPLPGLVEVAHAAGLRSAFLINWEPLRDLSRPGQLDFLYYRDNNHDAAGDQVIADEAVRYLSSAQPDFTFIYFGALDAFGHKHGWMSDGYFSQLARADTAVGTVLEILPDDAVVLLQSDHGGHERLHGTDQPADMTIPWIIAGPGVRPDHEIAQPVNLIDTAPTLAHVLGLDPHPEWEGRIVIEAFNEANP
jgi:predicted AlkP superfamily pyrophosphatase or phosphodiesterase